MADDPAAMASACATAMWAEDRASQALRMRIIDIAPGRAVLEMTVRPEMTNGHGIGHGGFTFALADSAFAFACNTYNRRTAAYRCDIHYLGAVREGDLLVAEAVERQRTGRNGIYDVTVRSGDTVVAEFRGTSREIGGALM
ncbi:MAG: hydroxyphenylacetyl-CoA thioesterase PaaI [Nocardioidaceae bacterium]|nr:hydroxyphenylacetyl-CoA thioesterase PaaI [Nocardioidaceae bacterium]